MKREKCEFAKTKIMFLGHVIGEGQVKMDPRKIQVIIEWSTLKTVPELRSFLGLANYYRQFIDGYNKKNKSFLRSFKEESEMEMDS